MARDFHFIARDAKETDRGADDEIIESVEEPTKDARVIAAKGPVRDVEFIDAKGRRARRWNGTPEQLAAMAAANPLSGKLFQIADRVWVEKATLDRLNIFCPEDAKGDWQWVHKVSGRILLQRGS